MTVIYDIFAYFTVGENRGSAMFYRGDWTLANMCSTFESVWIVPGTIT